CVYLSDSEEVIRKKVMRAKTDSGPETPNQEKPEAIENLFDLMRIVSTADTVDHFDSLYNKCEIRYGDFKKQLAEDIIIATKDIRERIKEVSADEEYVQKALKLGAKKARESAQKTIRDRKSTRLNSSHVSISYAVF